MGEEDGGSAVGDTGVVDKPSVTTLGAGVDHKDVVGRFRGGHLHHVSALELVPFGAGESSGGFLLVNHFSEVFSDVAEGGC